MTHVFQNNSNSSIQGIQHYSTSKFSASKQGLCKLVQCSAFSIDKCHGAQKGDEISPSLSQPLPTEKLSVRLFSGKNYLTTSQDGNANPFSPANIFFAAA